MIPTLDTYLSLIPPPNDAQPLFMAWVEANIQPYLDTQACLLSQITAFDLAYAQGAQLDIIGQILGVSRTLNFQPGGGLPALLPDDKYIAALYARIMLNQWRGTKDEIYDFWATFLPQYPIFVQDNQDMTMTVTVFGMPNDLSGAIFFGWDTLTDTVKGWDDGITQGGYWEGFQGVLRDMVTHDYFTPRPAGVRVTFIFSDKVLFGWDIDSTYLKGWDDGTTPGGYWAGEGEPEGSTLSEGLDFSTSDGSEYIPLI